MGAGVAAVLTTGALNWPIALRIGAAASAAVITVLLMTARLWGPWLYRFLQRRTPSIAAMFWHLCLDKHNPVLKRRVLTACTLAVAASFALYAIAPGARQWALVAITMALGALLGYLGLKCCRNRDGKGKVFAAIAGYLLSLSANYLADATARDQTGRTLASIMTVLEDIRRDVRETKGMVEQALNQAPAPRPVSRGNLHQVAPPPNRLLGSRQQLRAELRSWVTSPGGPKAVALVGEVGVNTTDIARALAAEVDPADPEATGLINEIWWLDAHPAGDPARSPMLESTLFRLVHQLGRDVEPGADLRTLASVVRADLSLRPKCLFVLDGVSDPHFLATILPQGACKTLVTTQRRDLPPELIYSKPVPRLTPEEALAFLTSKREDLWHATDDPALQQVIAEADGSDVALELCAAFLGRPSRPSPEDLARAVCGGAISTDHPLYLTPLARGASSDTRSVACVLSAAWADLPEGPELALLRCAAWCDPDNIPLTLLESAAELAPGSAEHVAEGLASRSIVRMERFGGQITLSLSRPVQRVLQLIQTQDADGKGIPSLVTTLQALDAVHRYPSTREAEALVHTGTSARSAAWPHTESVIFHARSLDLPEQAAALAAELAWHLRDIGQFDSALRHIDDAVTWGERSLPPADERLAGWRALRANIRQQRGDFVGALHDIDLSLQWAESSEGAGDPRRWTWYDWRSRIRQGLGDFDGAEADIMKCIAAAQAMQPPDERALAVYYCTRYSIYVARGDLASAEADLQRSIAWFEAQRPRDDRNLAFRYAWRANVRRLRNDLHGAAADIDASIKWFEAQSPRDERSLCNRYAWRARIRLGLKQYAAARRDIEAALRWFTDNLPGDEHSIKEFRNILSMIQQAEQSPGS